MLPGQLLPRLYSDVGLGEGLPNVVEKPVPTGMTSIGFTVAFTTQNAGDTKVEYGKTAQPGTVGMNVTPTTRRNVVLKNLPPGIVYSVKVSSVNGAGTSSAAAGPVSTDTQKRPSNRLRGAAVAPGRE
ncbi:hypothetical protein GCM10022408_00280 [Hymenobacter fastidiosus]|uniref:Fibronectin type-III domain-containing protein n=1 Tax=Hymenobacter fastidiosus TaxID=486264 RepID=A0ABP7RAL5_9BACT